MQRLDIIHSVMLVTFTVTVQRVASHFTLLPICHIISCFQLILKDNAYEAILLP